MRYGGRRRGNGTAGVALSRGWVMTMTEIMERVTGGLCVISGTWYPVRSFLVWNLFTHFCMKVWVVHL